MMGGFEGRVKGDFHDVLLEGYAGVDRKRVLSSSEIT